MRLVKATEKDNEKLLHYFTQSSFPGAVTIRMRRMFNFFNQYRIQSPDFVTYMLLNDADEIEAMASIVFREAWIEGKKETVGYATDLRVSTSRRAVLTWSQHFLPVIEEARESRGCRYIFTSVAQSQRQAYNAFIRPRSIRRRMPRYYLFRRFQLVSLHGLWPFHEKPLSTVSIRQATENDFDAMAEFIVTTSKVRPLHYFEDAKTFRAALERWRDLYIENFLIAEDKKGNILGTVAPWSSQQIQKVYAIKYDDSARNLKEILHLFSWFGISHPLPRTNSELKVRHLTHLYARNPDVFYSLLYHAFKDSKKEETLIYPHFDGNLLTLPPKEFISATQNFGFYAILSPNDPLPDFLKPSFMAPPPEFESTFL